jgi:hypothetical protein
VTDKATNRPGVTAEDSSGRWQLSAPDGAFDAAGMALEELGQTFLGDDGARPQLPQNRNHSRHSALLQVIRLLFGVSAGLLMLGIHFLLLSMSSQAQKAPFEAKKGHGIRLDFVV